MKDKSNKKHRIMSKKHFSKQQLLVWKKYPHLIVYDIPYPIINRAYDRYLKNLNYYEKINNNSLPHYYRVDKKSFSCSVKMYIERKKGNYQQPRFGTRGFVSLAIAKASAIGKYIGGENYE